MFEMSKADREELGKKGRQHVLKNYNFTDFNTFWPEFMENIHTTFGSWDTRKNYTRWEIETL
mgnify:FL=1